MNDSFTGPEQNWATLRRTRWGTGGATHELCNGKATLPQACAHSTPHDLNHQEGNTLSIPLFPEKAMCANKKAGYSAMSKITSQTITQAYRC
ncbi:hypothetical protein [Desulfovibrio cuneatus]|uniref:hypothetical protein n=1 Tax=Desulfovibrio cuneatus TaxID=159728 RepID=UPI00040BF322|nr:hypothetical protein [Desulfovibrio cuneatus]